MSKGEVQASLNLWCCANVALFNAQSCKLFFLKTHLWNSKLSFQKHTPFFSPSKQNPERRPWATFFQKAYDLLYRNICFIDWQQYLLYCSGPEPKPAVLARCLKNRQEELEIVRSGPWTAAGCPGRRTEVWVLLCRPGERMLRWQTMWEMVLQICQHHPWKHPWLMKETNVAKCPKSAFGFLTAEYLELNISHWAVQILYVFYNSLIALN